MYMKPFFSLQAYPDIIFSLLTPPKHPLSATNLQDLLVPVFSEVGSNDKVVEDEVVYFLMEFIKDTEGTTLYNFEYV